MGSVPSCWIRAPRHVSRLWFWSVVRGKLIGALALGEKPWVFFYSCSPVNGLSGWAYEAHCCRHCSWLHLDLEDAGNRPCCPSGAVFGRITGVRSQDCSNRVLEPTVGAMAAPQTPAWPTSHASTPAKPTAARARPFPPAGALVALWNISQVLNLGRGQQRCNSSLWGETEALLPQSRGPGLSCGFSLTSVRCAVCPSHAALTRMPASKAAGTREPVRQEETEVAHGACSRPRRRHCGGDRHEGGEQASPSPGVVGRGRRWRRRRQARGSRLWRDRPLTPAECVRRDAAMAAAPFQVTPRGASLLWRPRFPRERSWLRSASLSFSQAVSPQARAVPSLGLPSKLHTPAPRPGVHRHPSQAGVQARRTDHLRRSLSVLSAADQLLGLLLSPRGSSLAIPLLERGLI